MIVRNVLSKSEVSAVNRAFDYVIDSGSVSTGSRHPGDSKSLQGTGARWAMNTNLLELPDPHGKVVRDLMVHPQIVHRLNHVCGIGWRLDLGLSSTTQ